MLRIGFVYNTNAGRRFKSKKIKEIRDVLLNHGTVQEFEIKNPYSLNQEVVTLTSNFDLLVIAGGDGSVNGVINLLKEKTPPLLVLPFGSGNDISQSFHPKLNLQRINKALKELEFKKVDLMEISGKESIFCLTVACLGTDARVSKRASTMPRFLAGARYVLATIMEIFKNSPTEVTVTTDGFSYQGDVSVCSLANTAQYGGGIEISPRSNIADGQLELVFVKKLDRLALLLLFILLLLKQHTKSRKINFIKTNNIHLASSNQQLEVWSDGQFMSELPCRISVAKFKLSVLRV